LVPNRIVIGPFADGHHHIVLDKRTEASTGHVTFAGVEPAPGGSIAPSPAPAYAHRFAFYGDSITVGACNEDGPVDQWIDRRSHNAALSYAALTANAFKADLQNISISGMGMAIGWTPFLTDQVWNRLYPDPTAVPVDPSVFHPDVVFTNYGENDGSFATARKMAFPSASYLERYVAWVHELRATYPAAEIVILRGGMFNGANNPDLRSAWEAAVAKIESADPRVAHFVFKHWSGNHPRVPDDRAMADELVDWLHGQPFLGPHAPYSQISWKRFKIDEATSGTRPTSAWPVERMVPLRFGLAGRRSRSAHRDDALHPPPGAAFSLSLYSWRRPARALSPRIPMSRSF
jgi:lysophospholipase L1-like esterase